MFTEGESVRIKRNIDNLKIGKLGTVVARYPNNDSCYEVEFYNSNGTTLKLVTLNEEEISHRGLVEIFFNSGIISLHLLEKDNNKYFPSIRVGIEMYIFRDTYQNFTTYIALDDGDKFIQNLQKLINKKLEQVTATLSSMSPEELELTIYFKRENYFISIQLGKNNLENFGINYCVKCIASLETSIPILITQFEKLFTI